MKVQLPEHIGEITLEQFQKFMALEEREFKNEMERDIRIVSIFTDIHPRKIRDMDKADYDFILEQVAKALGTPHQFQARFTLDNVEYGIVPNFDKISTAEFADLELWGLQNIQEYHRIMAILFRPIIKKDFFGNYQIEPYEGTDKYAGVMRRMPLSVMDGALLFFWNLAKDLRRTLPIYSEGAPQKELLRRIISTNGDGMQPFLG